MIKKQFSDVPAKYGAPMGRRSFCDNDTATVRIFKVRAVDGDYDDGGAYWGFGPGSEPIYCARDNDNEVEIFTRAKTWEDARAAVLEDHPDLVIDTKTIDVEEMLEGYLTCALWSSIGEDGNPLDDTACIDDIASEDVNAAREECEDFLDLCQREDIDVQAIPMEASSIGHDFWLTRNHHGAGFWDRGLGELGKKLTALAQGYGGVDAWVDADGRAHLGG